MIGELIFVVAILFIGSFLQGASGFGFGLFSMSFLPFVFTLKDSTLIVVSLALVTSTTILIKVYKHLDYKRLLLLLSAAIVGRVGAFFVLHTYGELEIMKKVLGVVLIAMVGYILLSKNQKQTDERAEKAVLPIIMGLLGGFIGGIFMTGGPFFVFYLLVACRDKYSYTANLQAAFFLTGLVTLILHGIGGDLKSEFILYILAGIASVIIGSRLGMKWFDRLSQDKIKKIASGLVAAAGLNLIFFT
ncbi:sulfite exporter TauE/SafE family protein [Bacillus piscicola]|uniref:sulfite exporter TauE/SafE family protein n=1 Tax=Bacillus piscicola TaxID=1632684 RepID=UPI001F09A6A4|nr:sulfite exporter TauE/SafE family protein [Bacillus piscicola]